MTQMSYTSGLDFLNKIQFVLELKIQKWVKNRSYFVELAFIL